MFSQIVTTFGLVLDIVGAGILFYWAFPQPSLEQGVGFGLEDATVLPDGKTVAQHNKEIMGQKEHYINISKTGFALIIFGAVLQIVGTWMK